MAVSAGALTWSELAQVHFKSTVAEMQSLGPFNPMNGPASRKKSRITSLMKIVASDPTINQPSVSGATASAGGSGVFASAYSSEVMEDDLMAAIDITAPTLTSKLCTKRNFYIFSNS